LGGNSNLEEKRDGHWVGDLVSGCPLFTRQNKKAFNALEFEKEGCAIMVPENGISDLISEQGI